MKIELIQLDKDNYTEALPIRNENVKYFFDSHPIGVLEHEIWFETRYHPQKNINQSYFFYLIKTDDGTVGTIAVDTNSYWHIMKNVCVLRKYRGKGIMTKAIDMLMKKHPSKDWGE